MAGRFAWLRKQATRIAARFRSGEADEPPEKPASQAVLPSETIKYLSELAQASYDRQADLDESVWRSLPFFTAALALAVTLLNGLAARLPAWAIDPWAIASNLLFWLSVLAFIWTLRWFWEIISPRTYVYPAEDSEVWEYAKANTAYHAALGLNGDDLDQQVLDDLRAFMARQLAYATQRNFTNNARRLKARSQLLLFVMVGFILVIFAQGITYGGSVFTSAAGDHAHVEVKSDTGRERRTPAPTNSAEAPTDR
jgi:hypothetical protein